MRTLLAATLVALALAACGDSTEPANDFAASARGAAPAVPLTVDDVAAGWEALPDDENLAAGVSLPEECDIFDLELAFPGAVATASGDGLKGPLGQQVTSYSAVFETEGAAQAAIDGTREIVTRCTSEFKSEIKAIAERESAALGVDLGIFADINVDVGEREDVPAIGDGSVSYRAEVNVDILGNNINFTLDVTLLRSGRVAAAMTYAQYGEPKEEDETAVTSALLGKAEAAEEQLPPGSS